MLDCSLRGVRVFCCVFAHALKIAFKMCTPRQILGRKCMALMLNIRITELYYTCYMYTRGSILLVI